ncbi:MAG: hypothetical protein CNLJKLNK_00586 [Holosporales bacterium]
MTHYLYFEHHIFDSVIGSDSVRDCILYCGIFPTITQKMVFAPSSKIFK